jgi:GGDEF domain-containing protein
MSPEEKTPPALVESTDQQRIPHLVALNGPEVGAAFRLSQPRTVLGAGSAVDIQLTHATVSRRHAVLALKDDGTVWIEDAGSRNGTYVGLERVQEPAIVPDGSNIGLGAFIVLRFTYSPVASEALRRFAGARARLKTRNYLLDLLTCEYAYAHRHGTALSIVFVRADAIATVGPTGDVLREEAMGMLGTEIDSVIRTEDFLAVAGRDEFAVLVRGTGDDAYQMAERVRARIESKARVRGSTFAFHTVTAVVVPFWTLASRIARGATSRPPAAEDILSAARKAADPTFESRTNAVVRVQALVM